MEKRISAAARIFVGLAALSSLPTSAGAAAAAECSVSSAGVNRLQQFAEEILRPIAGDEFERDANAFCDEKLAQRFLASPFEAKKFNSLSPDYSPKATNDEIVQARASNELQALLEDRALKEYPTLFSAGNALNKAWALSLIPTERIRSAPYNDAVADLKNQIGGATCSDKLMECPSNSSAAPADSNSASYFGISNVELAKTYACGEMLGALSALRCGPALEIVKRVASPAKGSTSITGVEIYERVLKDARYEAGLRRAALKLSSLVSSGIASGGDYFSDVKNAFIESGKTNPQAEEMAWNVLGLISTAGPNIDYRLESLCARIPISESQRASLNLIALSLPVLDHRSAKSGKLYSWPPGVSGRCNSGKSYHFWFAAYLARRAALESGDPQAAAVAAYQAAKLYNFMGRNALKGWDQTAQDRMSLRPADHIIRADLGYAASGSVFGVNRAGNRNVDLDVDHSIGTLIRSAGDGQPSGILDKVAAASGNSSAANYLGWKQSYNPNAAFDISQKAGYPGHINREYIDFERAAVPGHCTAK